MADNRFDMVYNNEAVSAAAFSQRWAALAKLDVDIDTMRTWDRGLPRDKRILVPVDVQAHVVPAAAALLRSCMTEPMASRISARSPTAG